MSNSSEIVDYRPSKNQERNVQSNNQPQLNAMASGSMLLIAGGMDLAFGIEWSLQPDILMTAHLGYCWFIGLIAGAFIAAPLIPYFQKRFYIIVSAILILVSGIIYTSFPFEYNAILAARYVNGCGIGLTIVSFIVHGSEIALPTYRGAVLSLEQYAITFGLAIQLIYKSQWSSDINFASNRMHGIFLIIFALLALATIFWIIESPIYHLQHANEHQALDCLRQLQRPAVITNETEIALQNLKGYVIQEQYRSLRENIRKSLNPLFKMILYRCMVAFTLSIVSTYVIVISSFYSSFDSNGQWTLIIFALLRAFGTFLGLWLVDGMGRKLISIISLLCVGGITMGVGFLFNNDANLYDSYKMSAASTLILIAQFFGGLFILSTSIYMGEAFPLPLKPYLIALCVSAEQVIQIATIIGFDGGAYNTYVYCLSVGAIMCGGFLYFCLVIPETRKTTLAEAQKRFRNTFNLKMY